MKKIIKTILAALLIFTCATSAYSETITDRITSYNVCYTKLLRLESSRKTDFSPLDKARDKRLSPVGTTHKNHVPSSTNKKSPGESGAQIFCKVNS